MRAAEMTEVTCFCRALENARSDGDRHQCRVVDASGLEFTVHYDKDGPDGDVEHLVQWMRLGFRYKLTGTLHMKGLTTLGIEVKAGELVAVNSDCVLLTQFDTDILRTVRAAGDLPVRLDDNDSRRNESLLRLHAMGAVDGTGQSLDESGFDYAFFKINDYGQSLLYSVDQPIGTAGGRQRKREPE